MARKLVPSVGYYLIIILIGAWPFKVEAKLTLVGISGYSYYDSTATKPAIYGGMVDSGCSTSGDGTSTCNSCTTDLKACNAVSIYPSLKLVVTFSSDANITGDILAASNTTAITLDSSGTSQTTSFTKDQNYTVAVTWSSICAALISDDTGTCTTGSIPQTNFTVGVDTDSDGSANETISFNLAYRHVNTSNSSAYTFHTNKGSTACADVTNSTYEGFFDFTVKAGDGKVYVKEPCASATYDSTGVNGIKYKYVRFYYEADSSFAAVTPTSSYVDLSPTVSEDEITLSDKKIPDLENGKTYYFRMANVDTAGNVTYMSPTSYLDSTKHSARPAEVVGVLEDKKCFIATAAFGSEMAPQVETFRQFRNKYLLPYSWGKKFVQTYYKLSPPLADFISKHEWLRSLTRAALYPFLWSAEIFVSLGFLNGSIIFLILFGLASSFLLVRRKSTRIDQKVLSIFFILSILCFSNFSFAAREPHPLAEKGLLKIDKDRIYYYDVKQTKRTQSMSIKFGTMDYPVVVSSVDPTLKFNDFYGSGKLGLTSFDYEWQPFTGFGSLGLQFGTGFTSTTGSGKFKDNSTETPEESYTFYAFPTHLSLVYRFQFVDRQWFAPYVAGGVSYVGMLERRDDGKYKTAGTPGVQTAGGVLLSISALSKQAAFDLDAEYGINHLWLALEMKILTSATKDIDFTSNILSAGLTFDF